MTLYMTIRLAIKIIVPMPGKKNPNELGGIRKRVATGTNVNIAAYSEMTNMAMMVKT